MIDAVLMFGALNVLFEFVLLSMLPPRRRLRLLGSESASCCLCMEAEHLGTLICYSETFLHDLRPDFAGSTELRDLFKEIVVRVEEEGETFSEYVRILS